MRLSHVRALSALPFLALAALTAPASAQPPRAFDPPMPKPACTPLKWDGDKMNADPATFEGKVDKVVGEDMAGNKEPFYTLALTTPVCDPDGAPVPEVQIYNAGEPGKPGTIAIGPTVDKHVKVTGPSFTAMTAHHHRPIVVEVTALTILK